MPNKYSHRLVLYNYASAGLIQSNDAFLEGQAPPRGRGRARSPVNGAESYHEFLSNSSRQSVCSDREAQGRISWETGSERDGVISGAGAKGVMGKGSERVKSPRSKVARSPRGSEGRKRAIRIQPSVEELPYTQVEKSEEEQERKVEERWGERASAMPPVEARTAEKQDRKDSIRSDRGPSRASVVPPSSPPPQEASVSKQDSTHGDTHQNCSKMACSVNCFQPALSHTDFDLTGPNQPRPSTSNSELATSPRAAIPAHACGDSRPVLSPSQQPQSHLESPTPPSTGKTLIDRHAPPRRQPSPPRPASTLTQIFDPLPTTADFSDFDSFSSPTSPVQQSTLSRRFSLDSLSSLSSFSSLNTDAPTLTAKSPSQQDPRLATRHSRKQSASHSFWNNVASCGDTLALAYPPPASARTSVDDLSSYPPDIPTRRQLYQLGGSQGASTSQSHSHSQSQSHRAAMLASPPPIPLNGQRAPRQEVKKNWFGVGSVLKKKKNANDGTVRNSSGLVVGARS